MIVAHEAQVEASNGPVKFSLTTIGNYHNISILGLITAICNAGCMIYNCSFTYS